jgi:hypothetical protein
MHEGLKVQKNCGDGLWRIEKCPPQSNTHCFAIQRGSKEHCEAKIIKKTTISNDILSPYYDGLWCDFKWSTCTHHKFLFCVDDLTHYVRGTRSKYVIDRLVVLVIWFMQVVIELTWDGVTTLKEGRFVLCKQQICPP